METGNKFRIPYLKEFYIIYLLVLYSLLFTFFSSSFMPVPDATEKNSLYGKFAATSRLIACLVTEALVPAYFFPTTTGGDNDTVGVCVLCCPKSRRDLLAAVPLRGYPELGVKETVWNGVQGYKVELVDPWDMLPQIYAPSDRVQNAYQTSNTSVKQVVQQLWQDLQVLDGYDAVALWLDFAKDYGVNDKLSSQIAAELESSIIHQSK